MAGINEIEVWQGTVASPGGKHRFGGWTSYRDNAGRAVFIVSVLARDTEARDVELREGDTFTVGEDVWRAVEIVAPGSMAASVKLRLVEDDQSDPTEDSTALPRDDDPPWHQAPS